MSQSGASKLSNNGGGGGGGGLMLEKRGNIRRLSCCAAPIEEVGADNSRDGNNESCVKCESAADAV